MMLVEKSFSLELVDNSINKDWTVIDIIVNGCSAYEGKNRYNTLWVGDCSDGLPHGKGFIIAQGKLFLGGMNRGREYRRIAPIETPDVQQYFNKANYLADFTGVIYSEKENKIGQKQSILTKRAMYFLSTYQDAPFADRKLIEKISSDDELRILNQDYISMLDTNVSSDIRNYINQWADLLPNQKKRELFARADMLDASEKKRTESAAAAARQVALEKQNLREKMRVSACNIFYPGYVGKYKSTGWLATADQFIVRYVTAAAKSVTIEGVESGNSLKYGQHVELSCFNLWERSQ